MGESSYFLPLIVYVVSLQHDSLTHICIYKKNLAPAVSEGFGEIEAGRALSLIRITAGEYYNFNIITCTLYICLKRVDLFCSSSLASFYFSGFTELKSLNFLCLLIRYRSQSIEAEITFYILLALDTVVKHVSDYNNGT